MNRFALLSGKRLLAAIGAAALLSSAPAVSIAQPDPPAQAGRLSYVSGDVSVQPDGSEDWQQAVPNLPLGPGDRIFTDSSSRAEIQIGQTFVRIGQNSDVSLIDSTSDGITFGVAQGAVRIRVNGLWQDQSVYVNTPSGSVALSEPGDFRVDVEADSPSAAFSSFGANLYVTGAGGFAQNVAGDQSLQLVGSNPVLPQWLGPEPWNGLDDFSRERDMQIAQAVSYQYVSREVPGANELDAAGQWMPGTPYGPVWFPNNVSADWAPYHNGHWVNHAPWGWVWVEDESWGYAPFHYGRWVSFEGRWGWVPGPPEAHPVWSPALVVFAGGIHVGGVGVSAWFPLGPGEAYHPWYRCSPRYVDEVNISNIRESPRVHVQNTYVNINITNVTYINRTIAVSAMNTTDFAAGRHANHAAVAVDTRQMEHVQVMAAPEAVPLAHPMVAHPPVKQVTVSVSRPVLINQRGMAIAAKPGAQSMAPPVKPVPAIRPIPGRAVMAPPANAVKPTAPATPEMHATPAVTAPVKPVPTAEPAKPEPKVTPQEALPPAQRPVVPAAPKTVTPPAVKPATPAPAKPVMNPAPPPQAHTPPPAQKGPGPATTSPAVPPAEKPATSPTTPPKGTKPSKTPPAKTDTKPDQPSGN